MSDLTDYAEDYLLDYLFRAGGAAPVAYFLGLHDGDPAEDGLSNEQDEVSDTEYDPANQGRPAITFGAAASGGQILNTVAITYTPAVAAAAFNVTHVSIWDSNDEAGGPGNCYFKGELQVPRTIDNGNPFSIAIGDLVAALA